MTEDDVKARVLSKLGREPLGVKLDEKMATVTCSICKTSYGALFSGRTVLAHEVWVSRTEGLFICADFDECESAIVAKALQEAITT